MYDVSNDHFLGQDLLAEHPGEKRNWRVHLATGKGAHLSSLGKAVCLGEEVHAMF